MSLSTETANQIPSEQISYSPSWFDRFSDWMEKLPGSYLLYYVALGIGVLAFLFGAAELGGEIGGPITDPMRMYVAFIIPYLFGMAHFLDLTAGKAIEKLRPSLRLEGVSLAQLQSQITTLPARPALLASIAAVVLVHFPMFFTTEYIPIDDLDPRDTSQLALLIAGVLFWWTFGLVVYHTVHQLRAVSRIYTEYVDVNLYRLGALYALSTITAITSIGIIVAVAMAVALVPTIALQALGIAVIAISLVLAGITFAWPLWGVHRIMIEEKERMQAECSKRYESLMNDWHLKVDSRELDGSGDLHSAIKSLLVEKGEIHKIPTWPWTPGILRGWISALFLPLAVWLLQWFVERFLLGA